MFSKIKRSVMLLAMLLALAVPVLAQEDTATPPDLETPTAEVTPEQTEPPVIIVITPTVDPAFTPVPVPTDTPPDDNTPSDVEFSNTAWIIFITGLAALVVLFGYLIRPILVRGLQATPAILRPGIYTTADSFIAAMRAKAAATADLADDESVEKLVQEWEQIKREVDPVVAQAARTIRR